MRRLAIVAAGFAAMGVVYARVLRPRHLRWGATGEEVEADLPGDELIPHPSLVATRAISVRSSADRVWPWIAQLGQGRGGFYSYDWLENLFGCDIHSADRIVPGWQDVAIGDDVRLAPEVALSVAAVDPGRSLVLRGGVPMGTVAPPYDFTWSFALQDGPDGTTRLLVRERYGYRRGWAPFVVEPVELVSFFMHEKMLRTIKERAERTLAWHELAGGR